MPIDRLRAEVERLGERTDRLSGEVHGSNSALAGLRAEVSRQRRLGFVLAGLLTAAVLALCVVGWLAVEGRAFLCDTTAVLVDGKPSTPNGVRVQEQTRQVRGRYGC